MIYTNLYNKIAREVSEVLDSQYIAHRIEPDTMQNELVVTFDKPLFGEAKAYANEALDAAVSYVQTLVGLKHRPNFDIISPFKATVKKYFAETDFARK
ncbi:MAG: hypothetical protein J6R21_04065 [Bacteroidales bacterium]|nr:hypothetical protein [Bacteroidales bacterium]MBO7232813.1 hypothetical protein [Bacteroidales bacterium]